MSSHKSDTSGQDSTTTGDSDPLSGFKSFWRKKDDKAASRNVTFVSQDPTEKRKSGRLSRILNPQGASSVGDRRSSDGASHDAQKRRQQVYQAQKRHRNRKGEYVQSLEAEIARLQHLDAVVNSEKNSLAHENKAIRDFLASQSLDLQLDSLDLSSSSAPSEYLHMLGGADVSSRFDTQIGQERVFLDLPEMSWSTPASSVMGKVEVKPTPQREPVKGDSWAALDFILALEWPCREHVHHHGLNPAAAVPAACEVGGFHGHALTTTGAVYQSAIPAPQTSHDHSQLLASRLENQDAQQEQSEKWQLPHSEIEKLVQLSKNLPLDDEQLTPAQAYSAICDNVPSEKYVRPVLEELKVPLAMLVQCSGYGAWMETGIFYENFSAVLETLKFTRPELAR